MDNSEVIHVAAYAGKIILESGGETYRVEETIGRICTSFGINEAESFVMPTGIIISITDKTGDTVSIVKRIKQRRVNLENVAAINELSRRACNEEITISEMKNELGEIEKRSEYNNWISILFAGISSSFFALIFKGTIKDFIAAFIAGMIVKGFTILLAEAKTNDFFANIFGGALTAALSIIAVQLNVGNNLDIIIIGVIMQLVPGLLLTNAIRDTISGDLVAGISRVVEAILIACAIAIGTGLVLKLWIGVFGGVI